MCLLPSLWEIKICLYSLINLEKTGENSAVCIEEAVKGEKEEVGDSTNCCWVLFYLFKIKMHLTHVDSSEIPLQLKAF